CNAGISFNGVETASHIFNHRSSGDKAGIKLNISGASHVVANQNICISHCNLFNNSAANILIGGFSYDIRVRDSWFEESPYGVLLQPDAGTSMEVDGFTLDGVTVWNASGDSFTGT